MSAAWPVPTSGQQKARLSVNRAVKQGKLPRARDQSCVNCGEQADDYHHYEGYEKEHYLTVVAVCRACHNEMHTKLELETFPSLTAQRRRRWEKRRERWREWYNQKYYPRNRAKIRAYYREYYQRNREKIIARVVEQQRERRNRNGTHQL